MSSGRGPEPPRRSSQPPSFRNQNFVPGRGGAGRGPGSREGISRGNGGVPPKRQYGPAAGVDYELNQGETLQRPLGGPGSVRAGNPDGVEGAQTSRTGAGAPVAETRLTMPQGFGRSNPGVDQTLQFGSFPTAADGMPVLSPVPDRAHSAASSSDQRGVSQQRDTAAGRSQGGRGPIRQGGMPINGGSKPKNKGPQMQGPPGGQASSPVNFGQGVPPQLQNLALQQGMQPGQYMPMHPAYAAAYAQYGGMGQVNAPIFQGQYSPGYPAQMAGYGVGAYSAGAYGPQTDYRGGQQMYQGNQGGGRGTAPPQGWEKPHANKAKSKALSIVDPSTHKPLNLDVKRPVTAPVSAAQPKAAGPYPAAPAAAASRPQQNGIHKTPVAPRPLTITPPPASQAKGTVAAMPKAAKTSGAVVTTPTPTTGTAAKEPAAPAVLQDNGVNQDAKPASLAKPSEENLAPTVTEGGAVSTSSAEPNMIRDAKGAAAAKAEEEAKAAAKAQADAEKVQAEAVAEAEKEAAAKAERAGAAAKAEKEAAAKAEAAAEAEKQAAAKAEAEAAEQKAKEAAAQKAKEEAAQKAEAEAAQKAKAEAEAQKSEAAAAAQKAEAEAAAKEAEAKAAAAKKAEEETKKAEEEAKKADEQAALAEAEKAAAEAAAAAAKPAAESSTEAVAAVHPPADANPVSASPSAEAEATSSSQPEEAATAERAEPSTSAAAEEPSSSSAVFVPPHKKKGKALRDVIARKEAQESSQPQDSRAVDVSAYTNARPAEVEAKPSTSTSPPPVATPDRQTEAPKGEATALSPDEPDDWENATIETPRASAVDTEQPADDSKKRYSRDFLEKLRHHNSVLPEGFADRELLHPSLTGMAPMTDGRGRDFGPRGGRGVPPPGIATGDLWARGKGFQPSAGDMRGHPPGISGPPPPPGGKGGRGPGPQRGAEADQWSRGTLRGPPGPPGPRVTLHKAGNRYERGKLISENPEEERRQKEIKSLLNKITPEKYDIIRDKVIAVGIDSVLSLRGLIDQVFDKALTEPTFCEIYATLCKDLNKELPEFEPEEGEDSTKKVCFRKVLLNKCQEEFEEGTAAIEAVKTREQADADKAGKEEEEVEAEEGEITAEQQQSKRSKRMEEALKAEAEQKARRRALGNIQFIGQLYKERMLTEKIMHSCIQTLLGEVENPRKEDIECLCRLMATIGEQLDASPKAHSYMNAYFERMRVMTERSQLEVRLRFLLLDTIDLRHNKWKARRKTEGPKTLSEIHRDAANDMRRPPPGGRGGGGGFSRDREPMPPRGPPARRHVDRLEEQPRLMQRTPSQEGFLGPGGRPGGGGFRPGGSLASRGTSPAPQRDPSPSSSTAPAAPSEPQRDAGPSTAPSTAAVAAPSVAPLSADMVKNKAAGMVREFVANRSTKDALETVQQELVPGNADMALVIETWFTTTFEEKGIEKGALKEMVLFLLEEGSFSKAAISQGIAALLNQLGDTAVDVPFAPELLGVVVGSLIGAGLVEYATFAESVRKAGVEEPGELVESGFGGSVVAYALQQLKEEAGADAAKAAVATAAAPFTDFLASFEREDAGALEGLLKKHDLHDVVQA